MADLKAFAEQLVDRKGSKRTCSNFERRIWY